MNYIEWLRESLSKKTFINIHERYFNNESDKSIQNELKAYSVWKGRLETSILSPIPIYPSITSKDGSIV